MDSEPSRNNELADPQPAAQDKFATTRESAESGVPMSLQLKSAGRQTVPFGRYEIQRVLGEGAMGSVFLARDTQLQRQVAIKVPKLDDGDSGDLHRFYREARTMATLRHPHLCPVFDVGEFGGVHFFTMAYIEGGTLVDYLTEGQGLPDRQVARLIAKTASALDAAHKAGIIHRDLKPANIMIDRNKEPVVMDFGLAGVADAKANLTQWGEMLGTPAYMAPEQIRGDLDAVGPTSDVYSLGAIMYQMLTGRIPFDGSVATVVRKALDTEPAELASLAEHLDPDLCDICRKAMSKDPGQRFDSAGDMANALRDFLIGKHRSKKATPPSGPARTSNNAQLEQQAARVRELWGEAKYAEALPILKSLSRNTDAPAENYAAWAREEIPKVHEKIKQSQSEDDWLTSANVPQSAAYLRPPTRFTRTNSNDPLPPWLVWAMAAPAAVILFLIVLVIATSWSNSNSSDFAIEPSSANAKSKEKVASDARRTGKKNKIAKPKVATPSDPQSRYQTANPTPNPSPPIQPWSVQPPNVQPPANNDAVGPPPQGKLPQSPRPNGEPPNRPPPPRDAAGVLRRHDANNDGQLTPEEIPLKHRPHLMCADTDGDMILTFEELKAFHQNPDRPPPPR